MRKPLGLAEVWLRDQRTGSDHRRSAVRSFEAGTREYQELMITRHLLS